MHEPPLASPLDQVKTAVRQRMIEQFPTARFAWLEPPMVEEPLRIGVDYEGQRHYVALTEQLIEHPDEAIHLACAQLCTLIERKREKNLT